METVTTWAGFTLDELLDSLENTLRAKIAATTFHDMQQHHRRAQLIREELHSRCQ
ncbi:hypothetical protein [Glutamicibacter arilaitensis]|uniref:hypothetical protein n=1 Tax=Glutamicibacter arilaitensis TaxID=256701 RepID=UPI0015E1A4D0|nr:hypothetical protein [Glutamicibacter arilaitensis]